MLGVTSTVEGAALPRPPAAMVRVTVTGLRAEDLTMATVAVRETWCVAVTTAGSSVHTTMKRLLPHTQEEHKEKIEGLALFIRITAATFRKPWPSLSLCP